MIPEQIRTALILRDGGVSTRCAISRARGLTDIVQHWSRGERQVWTTSPCSARKHHHKIHAENIPITFDSDGKPRVEVERGFKDRS